MKTCPRCKKEVERLVDFEVNCGIKLDEGDIPFHFWQTKKGNYYKILICQHCRDEWAASLVDWWNNKIAVDLFDRIKVLLNKGEGKGLTRQETITLIAGGKLEI